MGRIWSVICVRINGMRIIPPYPKSVILAVLAFVAATGYGGFTVLKDDVKYGLGFDKRLHEVTEIVDGDTIVVDADLGNGKPGVRVRLLGIDAPELGSCYGEESQKGLAKLILGSEVFLEKDQNSIDKYGRLLRYVVLHDEHPQADGVLINQTLVERGLARSLYMRGAKRYHQAISSSAKDARAAAVGLWGQCDYSAESDELEQGIDTFDKECVIKGNVNKRYEKDYFVPGCPNYKRVKIDPRKGERWFCSESEAQKAGWQISAACSNPKQFEE